LSSPSQGRTQDAENLALGPFITENSLFNPTRNAIGPQYGSLGIPEPPESHFNTQIVPPGVVLGGRLQRAYFIPYDYRINPISPYGLSTPNRSGLRLDADGRLFGGGVTLSGMADTATEKTGFRGVSPTAFLSYRAGLGIDLKPMLGWGLSLNGGWTVNDMRNGASVAFTSTLVDLGLDWKQNDKLTWSLGGRHVDYNGTLAYQGTDLVLAAFGYIAWDQAYDIGAVGLKWDIEDTVQLRLNYGSLYFTERRGTRQGWEADQGYGQVSIVF
jgi:hypothetical protein